MINYYVSENDMRIVENTLQLCEIIYSENLDDINSNDDMAYQKTFEMLSDDDIIFINPEKNLSELISSIGIPDDYAHHFSVMYERTIFSVSFMLRTYIKKRSISYNLNDSVIFASIMYHGGVYTLIIGSLLYSEYPQLKPWIRKLNIDRILREIN